MLCRDLLLCLSVQRPHPFVCIFLYATLNLYNIYAYIYICHSIYLSVYSNLFLSKCVYACLSFVCAIYICIICFIYLFLSQEENPAKIEKPRRRKTAGMKPKSETGTGEERWAGQGSEVTLGEQYLLASLQGQQNKLNLSSVGGFRLPQSYFSHRWYAGELETRGIYVSTDQK